MVEPFDVAACEVLAARAASGDSAALRTLILHLWPAWLEMIGSSGSMGSFARSEDHVRNVATRLVEKIQRREGHALRLFALWVERHPGKNFLDWIRIICANAVRDYVTEQLGPRKPATAEPSAKRLLNEFAASTALEELGIRPQITAAQTARELLEFAERHLAADQQRVLGLWLDGATFDDIAGALSMTSTEATHLQRAAVASLRRHFAPADGTRDPAPKKNRSAS